MKSLIAGLTGIALIIATIVACSTSSKNTVITQKYQTVEFQESEVPYIQAVKGKDGKMSAVVVTNSDNVVAK